MNFNWAERIMSILVLQTPKRKKKIKPLSPKFKGAFIKGHMGLPEKTQTD